MKVIKSEDKIPRIIKCTILQGMSSGEYYLVTKCDAKRGDSFYSLVSLTDSRSYENTYNEYTLLEAVGRGTYKYIGHSDDLLTLDLSGGTK